jgi:hypothetical protein
MEDIGVEEGLDPVHWKRVHSLDNFEHKSPPGLPFLGGKIKGDYGYIIESRVRRKLRRDLYCGLGVTELQYFSCKLRAA